MHDLLIKKKTNIAFPEISTILALVFLFSEAMFSGQASAETELRTNVSEKEMQMYYLWEDEFWVEGAEPANLVRHRNIIASARADQRDADVGEFAVKGHGIVAGTGVVLVKQVFRSDPYPDSYILLESGAEASQSNFWKLTIYLPDGMPDEGEVVNLGGDGNGAFALLTQGSLTDMRWSCFGYADKGVVTGVHTKKEDGASEERIVIGLDEPPRESEAPNHNVLLDIRAEFQMTGSDKATECDQYGPVREGVYNRMWFEKRHIDDLPWAGNLVGPLKFDSQ